MYRISYAYSGGSSTTTIAATSEGEARHKWQQQYGNRPGYYIKEVKKV